MSVCGRCGKDFDATTSGSNLFCPDCCREIAWGGFQRLEILEKSAEKSKSGVIGGIKDSGERTTFSTGAQRDMHSGKGRMDLLPWAAIIEVSKHCEAGALKYGVHNVDKGIPTSSLMDSAMRQSIWTGRGTRITCWRRRGTFCGRSRCAARNRSA